MKPQDSQIQRWSWWLSPPRRRSLTCAPCCGSSGWIDRQGPAFGGAEPRGEPTVPRPAASVILLRARRPALIGRAARCCSAGAPTPRASWPACGSSPAAPSTAASTSEEAVRLTALRELEEEVGVQIEDPGDLVPFSRWITPAEVKVRFDTWFYLARAPAHCRPEPDGEEIVDSGWFAPAEALAARAATGAAAGLPDDQAARGPGAVRNRGGGAARRSVERDVEPILPKVVEGETARRCCCPASRATLAGRACDATSMRGRGLVRITVTRSRSGRTGSPAPPRTEAVRLRVVRRRRSRPRVRRTTRASVASTKTRHARRSRDQQSRSGRPCSSLNRNGAVESQQPLPITSDSRSPRAARTAATTISAAGP